MGARRLRAAASVAVIFTALSLWGLIARPDLTLGSGFLFGDEGNNLWVASGLASGAGTSPEAFTPYGPLSAWTYTAAARAAGNSPLVFRLLCLLLFAFSLTLVTIALARHLSAARAALWTVVAVVPMTLGLGPLLGGLTVSTYAGLERVLLAAVLILWQPPDSRSPRRSLLIGALAGACQWVRFGTGLILVGGVIAADIAGERRARATWLVCAGALLAELLLAAWAFASLPAWMAIDLLWPVFVLESYARPSIDVQSLAADWRALLVRYGPACGAVAVLAHAGVKRVSRTGGPALSLAARMALILSVTYLLGSITTFRTEHHFRQYAWLLVVSAGFLVFDSRVWLRATALVLCVPAWIVMARTMADDPQPYRWLETPAAGRIAVGPDDGRRAEALAGLMRDAGEDGILVGPAGAGWHAAYGEPAAGRHAWFLPGAIRPPEAASVVDVILGKRLIAVCPAEKGLESFNFPAASLPALEAVFSVRTTVAGCLIAAKPASGSSGLKKP